MSKAIKDPKTTVEKSPVIESLFSVGAHFGYSKTRRHPSTKGYILGTKNRVEIIDLSKTEDMLSRAQLFAQELALKGKQILFVGTKNEARKIIAEEASHIGQPFVTERWIGGTFTNFGQIRKRVEMLLDLREKKETGGLDKFTKKERSRIAIRVAKLDRFFDGITNMTEKPGALFVVDSRKEEIAIKEARSAKIPVISLCNSDCDIRNIDYPIVANDSARESISYFVHAIATAYHDAITGKSIENSK